MLYISRRQALTAVPLAGFAVLGPMRATLAATPSCERGPTSKNDEGPYFKPQSPERASLLESGISGTKLIVGGSVLSAACQPIAGAILDFWQADADGAYDNGGFHLRGHQRTGPDGRFRLETVLPGLYPGRTRHIHVKAMAPGGTLLTTQLFFPGEERNGEDELFRPNLLLTMADVGDLRTGHFDFVLKTA